MQPGNRCQKYESKQRSRRCLAETEDLTGEVAPWHSWMQVIFHCVWPYLWKICAAYTFRSCKHLQWIISTGVMWLLWLNLAAAFWISWRIASQFGPARETPPMYPLSFIRCFHPGRMLQGLFCICSADESLTQNSVPFISSLFCHTLFVS